MPHPVMGISGDIEGKFEIRFKFSVNRENRNYELSDIVPVITNPYIYSLLSDGYISLIIKIVCVPTYKSWTFTNPTLISLSEDEIDIVIEVESFLTVNKPIYNYSDSTFDSIFSDTVIRLTDGDIVGLTGSKRIPISKENEKVSLGSIFKFSRIKAHEKLQQLNFFYDDDQITINYPGIEGQLDPVHIMFEPTLGVPYTALNIYLMPALTEAFRIIMGQTNDSEMYLTKRWAMVLDALLPEGKRTNDPFINAQRLIPNELPTNLAFKEFLRLKN